jgi:hypothetical protein
MAMTPGELDEFPIHQAPLPMDRAASSDRNFYDRCYLNAHDNAGEVFLIAGLGTYPNLGVRDAFATVRVKDHQFSLRLSDALEARSLEQRVGPLRIEVLEPLESLRLTCDHEQVGFDLTWTGSFPAVLEQRHTMLDANNRPTLDAQRFAQVGTWTGSLQADGTTYDVKDWSGTRDRSWGIRPIGEPETPGRSAEQALEGFWWLYAPLRFDDFAVIVIVQESPDGFRTLNDAVRVFPDGRVEQLGWPRIEIDYESGSRMPLGARLHLTTPQGEPLLIEVEPLSFVALHVGCGYGGDPEWTHGVWKGKDWMSSSTYDLTDADIVGRIPWGVIDHAARATCNGQVGWGLFEHASLGRHDPTGFADWMAVAP